MDLDSENDLMTTGNVLDIKKFTIHDGPGIRTTVFVKGCPLNCVWCHNQEAIAFHSELAWLPEKCIGCMYCIKVCPENCHSMKDGRHVLDRTKCTNCGECTKRCFSGALGMLGKKLTVKEVFEEIEKDKKYYANSGGGLTVSGGEPMSQFEFTGALLKKTKAENIHTCLETCGFAPEWKYKEILRYTDLFLYDYKESDPERHKKYTGVDNELILGNLYALDEMGAKIVLRCPLIPGYNDREEHFRMIGETVSKLKNLIEINLMPFLHMGNIKAIKSVKSIFFQTNKLQKRMRLLSG